MRFSSKKITVNTVKPTIHNVFLLDASASMSGAKYNNAVKGLNLLLENISKDTETNNTVMIVEFEQYRVVRRHELTDKPITSYIPMGTGGQTPLNQAIGETLEYVEVVRRNSFNENDKVLVNVFTDGQENSSQGIYKNPKFLGKYIKSLESKGFTTSFVGTKTEVAYAINTLNVDVSNTMVHNNTSDDITRAFIDTNMSRTRYSKMVAKGADVKRGFYTKTVN
jgi:uncharacterized protein YegL